VDMVRRRVKGEPLQYILGSQPFGPISIKTRPPTLIPRPETENWTLQLGSLLKPTASKPITVLDLCTGSGCIPILLGHLWPAGSTHALGVDISPKALSLATENAIDHNLLPLEGHGTCRRNTFDALHANILHESFPSYILSDKRAPFDLISSNPPYIPLQEYKTLSRSVTSYEDPRALLGDLDLIDDRGLTFYRHIAKFVSMDGILKSSGLVVLEVGKGQARYVEDILLREGNVNHTEIWNDLWGVERVVLGRRVRW